MSSLISLEAYQNIRAPIKNITTKVITFRFDISNLLLIDLYRNHAILMQDVLQNNNLKLLMIVHVSHEFFLLSKLSDLISLFNSSRLLNET